MILRDYPHPPARRFAEKEIVTTLSGLRIVRDYSTRQFSEKEWWCAPFGPRDLTHQKFLDPPLKLIICKTIFTKGVVTRLEIECVT